MNFLNPNENYGATASIISIDIKFVTTSPIQFQIKDAMRTSAPTLNKPLIPSLFQIAAHMEDFVPSVNSKSTPPRGQTPALEKSDGSGATGKISTISLADRKAVEFHLEAPFSESVKLAADFTEWEKFALDMIRSEDDVWYIEVPLPPGDYSYCFIVDGAWCDDPCSVLRLHNNPFGRATAVIQVA